MATRSTRGGSAASSASAPTGTPNASASAPAQAGGEKAMLLGSSILPSLVSIGGKDIQLGAIVAAAHEASGLTVEAWNELPETEREKLLAAQVDAMQSQVDEEARAASERVRAQEDEAHRLREAEAAQISSVKPAVKYPRRVQVSNNSGIALVEPITGAYIQAGGKAPIRLHDADHEHNVAANLAAVLAQNYLPESVLVIEDLPD
jgi:hypothetical protein